MVPPEVWKLMVFLSKRKLSIQEEGLQAHATWQPWIDEWLEALDCIPACAGNNVLSFVLVSSCVQRVSLGGKSRNMWWDNSKVHQREGRPRTTPSLWVAQNMAKTYLPKWWSWSKNLALQELLADILPAESKQRIHSLEKTSRLCKEPAKSIAEFFSNVRT